MQAESFTLSAADGEPVAFHLDCDNVGHLPEKLSVRRGALRVAVGK